MKQPNLGATQLYIVFDVYSYLLWYCNNMFAIFLTVEEEIISETNKYFGKILKIP